jgi:hypothetical protein
MGATESLTMLKRLVQHFPLSCPQHVSFSSFGRIVNTLSSADVTHGNSRIWFSVSLLSNRSQECHMQVITKNISN